MAIKKNPNRQEVIASKTDINYLDVATAGKFEAAQLPAGAIIVGGYFYSALTGPTNATVVVEDKAGSGLIANIAGTYGAGRVNFTPTGVKLGVPGYVKVTTTGNASAGTAYLYLEYILDKRSAFSEG
jgi:hypothetical protein